MTSFTSEASRLRTEYPQDHGVDELVSKLRFLFPREQQEYRLAIEFTPDFPDRKLTHFRLLTFYQRFRDTETYNGTRLYTDTARIAAVELAGRFERATELGEPELRDNWLKIEDAPTSDPFDGQVY